MKKIKDEYLGYELIDGDKYKLYRISSDYYKVLKMKEGQWKDTQIRFTSIINYLRYMETLEMIYRIIIKDVTI